jgi:hypothetical protein
MENYQFLIKGYECDCLGIGNILKCLITTLSINDDVKIVCAPDYIYGQYDTILDERFIFNPNQHTTKEMVRVYTCRFLLLYYEEAIQNDLPNEEVTLDPIHPGLFHWYFSKTKRIDWYYDPSLVHPHVRQRIFESIDKIKWKPIVMETVDQWHQAFSSSVALGLSIRTWTASHENNIHRPYSFEVYQQTIARVIEEHPEIQTFVLSVDQPNYMPEYVTYLSKTYPSRSLVILSHLPHLNGIQYAITKAFTLSRCSYFIGNRISTFSELVYWFGRCKPIVYPVF